ncbi:hypothetical protein SRHO_G00285530 [Serrasalmus rhombeus]
MSRRVRDHIRRCPSGMKRSGGASQVSEEPVLAFALLALVVSCDWGVVTSGWNWMRLNWGKFHKKRNHVRMSLYAAVGNTVILPHQQNCWNPQWNVTNSRMQTRKCCHGNSITGITVAFLPLWRTMLLSMNLS